MELFWLSCQNDRDDQHENDVGSYDVDYSRKEYFMKGIKEAAFDKKEKIWHANNIMR